MRIKLMIKFVLTLFIFSIGFSGKVSADNFTTGSTAKVFGTHEIVMKGPKDLTDPFAAKVDVIFSQGGKSSKSYGFYDGDGVWKVRFFVPRAGTWTWETNSQDEPRLDNLTGSFTATSSSLPGKLRVRANKTSIIENSRGEWFTFLGDTGYYLFHPKKSSLSKCKIFVQESAKAGLNVIRANVGGNLRGADSPLWYSRTQQGLNFNVNVGKNDDACIQWMLNTYPEIYIQLIPIPEKVTIFDSLPPNEREKALRYLIGRYGAYANVFWLLRNDTNTPLTSGLNTFGADLKRLDPWNNLRATGHTRRYNDPLWNSNWTNYSHLETAGDVSGLSADQAVSRKKYTWSGEDWYETYPTLMSPTKSPYFFRRLFWSYIMSGGGACYGGYWDRVAHMGTGMTHLKHIMPYFKSRKIDLGLYDFTHDALATTTGATTNHPHVARRTGKSYLVYMPHEHPKSTTNLNTEIAQLKLNLTQENRRLFHVEWFNPQTAEKIREKDEFSGTILTLSSPWAGTDVIVHLWSDA
jgi:hypothetical protein